MEKNNNRERLFYLDFVRAIAVILILLTHYNAWFVFGVAEPQLNKCVLFEYPFGIYIGDLGVSLFLIISGAALMYVYNGKLSLISFYKKRFLSIYPMFWMAYLVAVLPKLGLWSAMGLDIPKWRIFVTIAGMDGYLSEYGAGFYILGEWFLGFIVLFYLIFPILRVLIQKYEIITWIAIAVIYCVVIRYYNLEMAMSKCILIRLPELCFGMSLVKHRLKIKWPVAVFATLILIANTIIKPELVSSIRTTYVGIAFFIVLVFVADYVKYKGIQVVCAFLTKYSYSIFLVHHVIFEYIQAAFDANTISVTGSYGLFAVSVLIIIPVAYMLNVASDSVCDKLKKYI
ncbi:MAG: acyltransferase [Lachnospiraceae bacterium]|nr:acyltransferase [Lachnospiraceae bacterium]